MEVNFLDLVRAASFALSFGMALVEKGLLVRVPIKNVRSYSSMATMMDSLHWPDLKEKNL